MPIFISRFSPERSLVGNFLAPRVRQTGNEGTDPQSRTRRGGRNRSTEVAQDRLELSQGQPAGASQATAQTSRTLEAPAAPSQSAQVSNAAGANVSTATATRSQAAQSAGRPADEMEVPASNTGSFVLNLGRRVLGAAGVESETDGPGLANLVFAIREENLSAVEAADPDRLQALATEMDTQAEEAAGVPAIESDADEAAALAATRAAERAAVTATAPPVQEPVAREIQQQELQRDLQTIASGLRADAAIPNQRNVAQTERNVQQAAEEGRGTEVQENKSQIQSLQTERRQLQQDAQQADRAIRQLQNRNARLQSGPNGSTSSGTTLDLHAQ